MQLNPRRIVTQFAHILQEEFFPLLESAAGPLSGHLQLLAAAIAMTPLDGMISARRASTGRPSKDRAALATAFIAKAIFNLSTTRSLISRLEVDEALRRYCGWASRSAIPHESKFSRAFAEFAESELPQQLHAAIVASTQAQRLIGHVSRDSTAIAARERFPETAKQKAAARRATRREKKQAKQARKNARGGKPKPHPRARAADRGTRVERQRRQTLSRMLKQLPTSCDIGTKISSQGHRQYWRGYKLHLDVADGQIPVSAVLTSARVHDSQVAIPLMTMTSSRVTYLYELMDSAYDADSIHAHSRQLNHVPIVSPHPRRAVRTPAHLRAAFPVQQAPQLTEAEAERFKLRTMSERVNARLKDEFGAASIRVRGGAKVMAHLMFGVLALTVDQWLRLARPG
jgi:hypothetical protein